MNKKFFLLLSVITILFLVATIFLSYHFVFETQAHFTPTYEKLNILPLLQKDTLSAEDYRCLFYQTGLSPIAIDELLLTEQQPYEKIQQIQSIFFEPIEINCQFNSIISKEERIAQAEHVSMFAPYSDSYLLLTSASHTFFYRNGHAALIIDSANHQTLEAAVLGSNSNIQSTKKWSSYPNFVLLRLKNLTPTTAFQITTTAKNELFNIPYRLTAGLFSKTITGTQCAHLVWYAFHKNGYDIDSDGGGIVTPHDILESDLLEIVQIYGFNPKDYETNLFN